MPTRVQEEQRSTGARPEGPQSEQAAAAAVQHMFDLISPRYDLLNHVLSMNVDRLWWWRTARYFRQTLRKPAARVLDLCCGTGDMGRALRKQAGTAEIIGADFSRGMLARGRQKFAGYNIFTIEGDALHLPFADRSFDLVVSAFGFRNLANYDAGLHEIHRVLRIQGEIGILDFNEPGGILGTLYGFYFRNVLPRIGTLISGVRGPYSYLPASVSRFPSPSEMLGRMRAIGFCDPSWTPYTFGIAGLYRGRR
ncbi:MAG: ubiquinone/menaquinone biosynthesis methyltransferase [Acidobacteria bacterium]|nr:ubiquinone/menaquinone biosynthesis methyltransferase [Acidobacteriota bacterium]MBV9144694.1 ubiquinone/menaquinone biosynthesis methyltransferase [Acidobacteriota bacterium]